MTPEDQGPHLPPAEHVSAKHIRRATHHHHHHHHHRHERTGTAGDATTTNDYPPRDYNPEDDRLPGSLPRADVNRNVGSWVEALPNFKAQREYHMADLWNASDTASIASTSAQMLSPRVVASARPNEHEPASSAAAAAAPPPAPSPAQPHHPPLIRRRGAGGSLREAARRAVVRLSGSWSIGGGGGTAAAADGPETPAAGAGRGDNKGKGKDAGPGAANNTPAALVKIAVLGDSGAGKSAMLVRHTQDYFLSYYTRNSQTIFNSTCKVNGVEYPLEIWDAVGDPNASELQVFNYISWDAIIICVSLESFSNLSSVSGWAKKAAEMSKGRAPLILVGTKADVRYDETGRAAMACNGKSIVTKAEGTYLANLIGATSYLECSAKEPPYRIDAVLDWAVRVAQEEPRRGPGRLHPPAVVAAAPSSSRSASHTDAADQPGSRLRTLISFRNPQGAARADTPRRTQSGGAFHPTRPDSPSPTSREQQQQRQPTMRVSPSYMDRALGRANEFATAAASDGIAHGRSSTPSPSPSSLAGRRLRDEAAARAMSEGGGGGGEVLSAEEREQLQREWTAAVYDEAAIVQAHGIQQEETEPTLVDEQEKIEQGQVEEHQHEAAAENAQQQHDGACQKKQPAVKNKLQKAGGGQQRKKQDSGGKRKRSRDDDGADGDEGPASKKWRDRFGRALCIM